MLRFATTIRRQVSLDTPVDVAELAESVASQERRRLGLGEQPVEELRRLLEWDVGLRIFYWPLALGHCRHVRLRG